jgi:hypothetical protein
MVTNVKNHHDTQQGFGTVPNTRPTQVSKVGIFILYDAQQTACPQIEMHVFRRLHQ